jgi:hypothetical protein
MKYLKKYNENIDWDWVQEEDNPYKEIPYEKDGVIYGKHMHINKVDISDLKFQLEDRVKCLSSQDNNINIINKTGKIVDINLYDQYLIYFDINVDGHNDGNIPRGHAWWVNSNKLEKIENIKESINWDWVQEEDNPYKEIPYEKDGVIYGNFIHINKDDINDLKFQLEDRVESIQIIETIYHQKYAASKVGTIVDFARNYYLIYFDDNIGGHGQNNIPRGHAWWVDENEIIKV